MDKHRGAARLERLSVTDELQRVAVAFLARQQDRAPLNGLAGPLRPLGDFRWIAPLRRAPFEFPPAVGEVTAEQQGQTPIQPRSWMVRGEFEDALVTCHRFVDLAERIEGYAQIVVDFGTVVLELRGAAQHGDGFGRLSDTL